MTDDNDPEIVIPPEVQGQIDRIIAKHPEAKEKVGELFANLRQAMHAVRSGQYKSFDEAMEAITGNRPELIDDLDD